MGSAIDNPARAAKPASPLGNVKYRFCKPEAPPKTSITRVFETLIREVQVVVDEAHRFERLLDEAQLRERETADEKSWLLARVAYLEGENMGFREQIDSMRREIRAMEATAKREGCDCAL